MSLDAIKIVSSAEQSAKERLQAGQAEAKKLVSEAETSGRTLKERRQTEADAEVRRLMDETEKQAERNAAKILSQTQAKCGEMRVLAEAKLDQAAALIVGRVVNG